jgi:hypothetical protein
MAGVESVCAHANRNREVSVKNVRKVVILAIGLMVAQSSAGCALFDRDKDLPTDRIVKVLVFPVRSLQFENLICIQQAERLELTGSVRNISYSTLPNVQLRAEIIHYDPASTQKMAPQMPVGTLLPGESTQFSLNGTVDRPVRHVELHSSWGPPSYP